MAAPKKIKLGIHMPSKTGRLGLELSVEAKRLRKTKSAPRGGRPLGAVCSAGERYPADDLFVLVAGRFVQATAPTDKP